MLLLEPLPRPRHSPGRSGIAGLPPLPDTTKALGDGRLQKGAPSARGRRRRLPQLQRRRRVFPRIGAATRTRRRTGWASAAARRRRRSCRTTMTSSWRSCSASRRSRRRSRAPPSFASAGAASSPTPTSSAASGPTTANPQSLASSPWTSSTTMGPYPSSPPRWPHPTASHPPASPFRINPMSVCSSSGCRHGLALLFNRSKLEAVVWDPITGLRLSTALPPEMKRNYRHRHLKFDMYNGAVMGNCCSGAFKVVMVFTNALYGLAWACLYDSESGKWGNIISTAVPSSTSLAQPSILVGNAVCWLLHIEWGGVLRFDTDKQSLDVVKIPEDIHVTNDSRVDLLRTVDGGLGIAILSKQIIQLWGQTAVSDHVVTWVLQKTIELDKFISLSPSVETQPTTIVGFDEDNNVIFLWTTIGIFMIQLESMKFTALSKDNCI